MVAPEASLCTIPSGGRACQQPACRGDDVRDGDLDRLLEALDRLGSQAVAAALGLPPQQLGGADGWPGDGGLDPTDASLLACEGCSPPQEAAMDRLVRLLRGRRRQQQQGRRRGQGPARVGGLYAEGVVLGSGWEEEGASEGVTDAMYYI